MTSTRAKPKTGSRAKRKATKVRAGPTDAKLLKDDRRGVNGWFANYDQLAAQG